jgi:hypothetical protein
MFKFHITRFGYVEPETILDTLRKEFPNMRFCKGVYKDKRGIFALHDQDTRIYGEKEELDNGDVFFPPSPENCEKIKSNLKSFETEFSDRIPVTLSCGKVLNIFPASCQPKQFLFNKKKKDDSPYNKTTTYGFAAYDTFLKLQSKEVNMVIGDPMHTNIVMLALKESYTLPIEIWDSLNMISEADSDKIFIAGLGMDYEYLSKVEFPKSDGPC